MNVKEVLGAFLLVNNPIVLSEEETKDVQKAIKQLQQENKILRKNAENNDKVVDKVNWENMLLKKQLEELKSTNKVLSEELTKDKILKQDCLTTCCGIPIGDIPKLINQQKEFMEYLENEKDRLIKECSYHYTDSFDRYHAVNEDIYDEVDKNLSKFKEIMGGIK